MYNADKPGKISKIVTMQFIFTVFLQLYGQTARRMYYITIQCALKIKIDYKYLNSKCQYYILDVKQSMFVRQIKIWHKNVVTIIADQFEYMIIKNKKINLVK